jgi:activator of HSP90 ATPase
LETAVKEKTKPTTSVHPPTRRQAIAGIAIACCGAWTNRNLRAEVQENVMKQTPASSTNKTLTALHEEIDLKATPQRIYETLLSSKDFAAFSGAPAEIDPKAGGAFSMFNGMIVGRNVELVPHQRIVQAWRPSAWPAGTYSLVRFELKPSGSKTTVVLDHTSFPEGDYDHLTSGGQEHYWEPLKKLFA